MNVVAEYQNSDLAFIFACKNIKKGEQITYDYVQGFEDVEHRNRMLNKYGIVETEAVI